MPTVTRDGVALHYERTGEGPTVAFVNDVGLGAWAWGWQHANLAGPHEVVVWDLRGTGRSDAPDGPYGAPTLAQDLEAVLADAGVASAHLVGAGLGGMVALEYADRFGRAATLSLVGTAADGDAVTDRLEDLRVAPDAPEAAVREALGTLFGADLEDHPDVVADILGWRTDDDADLPAWDAQAAAMRAFSAPALYEVTLPTLVVHGTEDVVVPPSAGESLAERLPRGEFRPLEGAGHAPYVADSATVADAVVDHVATAEGES